MASHYNVKLSVLVSFAGGAEKLEMLALVNVWFYFSGTVRP
jgi:hypothetical protein